MEKNSKFGGLIIGILTFFMWGFFPMYFKMLDKVDHLVGCIFKHNFSLYTQIKKYKKDNFFRAKNFAWIDGKRRANRDKLGRLYLGDKSRENFRIFARILHKSAHVGAFGCINFKREAKFCCKN